MMFTNEQKTKHIYLTILVYISNSEYKYNINSTISCTVCIVFDNILGINLFNLELQKLEEKDH